jgi:hypothetical protein
VKTAVRVPDAGSTTSRSAIDSPGGASSRIVPTASASRIVALTRLERCTRNVSSGALARSPTTGTVTVCVLVPAGKVREPTVAV